MTEKPTVILEFSTTKLPGFNEFIKCPEHPTALPEVGFGLAGGGYGVYTVCPECARILSKTLEPDDES